MFSLDHMTFDLKVDTYRGAERLLPILCVAFENLSNDNYQYVGYAVFSQQIAFNYHETRFFLWCLFQDNFLRCRPFVHLMTVTNITPTSTGIS